MNRVGLGLAIGAGYLLGRTKKLKFAVAVGTMVAGKRMNLTPRGIADLVSTQLQNNPQFKEIGDQLRQDMQGVGKAATGALVERQINGLADRLQGRTSQVRDQLSGVASKVPGAGRGDDRDEYDDDDAYDDDRRGEYDDAEEAEENDDRDGPERRERPERRGARASKTAKQAPAKKTAAKKTAAKKVPAKKTAAKRTQSATKTARGAARGARAGQPKGGGER